MIGVKSTQEDIVGRYDGKDYEFKRGITVACPDEAATHIFGYGLDDKSRALIRLGWVQNSTALNAALERLAQVQFLEADVKFKEPEVEALKTAAPSAPGVDIPQFAKQKK